MLFDVLTKEDIRARLEVIAKSNLHATLINLDYVNAPTRNERVMYDVKMEYRRIINTVNHHLGWAFKFDEDAEGINTIQAQVALTILGAFYGRIVIDSQKDRART